MFLSLGTVFHSCEFCAGHHECYIVENLNAVIFPQRENFLCLADCFLGLPWIANSVFYVEPLVSFQIFFCLYLAALSLLCQNVVQELMRDVGREHLGVPSLVLCPPETMVLPTFFGI